YQCDHFFSTLIFITVRRFENIIDLKKNVIDDQISKAGKEVALKFSRLENVNELVIKEIKKKSIENKLEFERSDKLKKLKKNKKKTLSIVTH
ncbi:hypothetical protein HK099_002745, partial [Clydaea vesicula]